MNHVTKAQAAARGKRRSMTTASSRTTGRWLDEEENEDGVGDKEGTGVDEDEEEDDEEEEAIEDEA